MRLHSFAGSPVGWLLEMTPGADASLYTIEYNDHHRTACARLAAALNSIWREPNYCPWYQANTQWYAQFGPLSSLQS
jgi:hypothetical protein